MGKNENGISSSLENHKYQDLSVFWKVNVLVRLCILNKNICTEPMGFPAFQIVGKIGIKDRDIKIKVDLTLKS